jgi:hypothetical protein
MEGDAPEPAYFEWVEHYTFTTFAERPAVEDDDEVVLDEYTELAVTALADADAEAEAEARKVS